MGKLWDSVREIVDIGWPRSSKRYPSAHRKASTLEKQHVGARKYNAFNRWIAKHIKKGDLAGKTTRSGRVKEAANIPKRFRWELWFHEKTEYSFLKPGKK